MYLDARCDALVTRSDADASQPPLLQDWSADEIVAVVGTIRGLRAEAAVSASAWLLEGLGTYWPQYQDKLSATVGDTRPQPGDSARKQDSSWQQAAASAPIGVGRLWKMHCGMVDEFLSVQAHGGCAFRCASFSDWLAGLLLTYTSAVCPCLACCAHTLLLLGRGPAERSELWCSAMACTVLMHTVSGMTNSCVSVACSVFLLAHLLPCCTDLVVDLYAEEPEAAGGPWMDPAQQHTSFPSWCLACSALTPLLHAARCCSAPVLRGHSALNAMPLPVGADLVIDLEADEAESAGGLVRLPSSFQHALCTQAWAPSTDNSLQPPGRLFLHTEELKALLGVYVPYLASRVGLCPPHRSTEPMMKELCALPCQRTGCQP